MRRCRCTRTAPVLTLNPEPEPSEERLDELIRLAANLDREALGELYRLYAPRIHRFVAYQVNDRVLAEDLTNQVFMRAMKAIGRYQHHSVPQFNAWLFRIAKNVVVAIGVPLPAAPLAPTVCVTFPAGVAPS